MRAAIIVMGIVGAWSTQAWADETRHLRSLGLGNDPGSQEGVHLVLEADGPISRPRVVIDGDTVRFWFYHTEPAMITRLSGGNGLLSRLSVRDGYRDSTLLHLILNRQASFKEKDLRYLSEAQRLHIWVPAVADAAVPAPFSGAASAAPTPPKAAAARQATKKPLKQRGLAASSSKSALKLKTAPAHAFPWQAILVFCLALVALWGGTLIWQRRVKQRGGGASLSGIDVVATKHLGPRLKLLVVRALGADHLLLMQGNRTEYCATVPCSDETPLTDAATARALAQRQQSERPAAKLQGGNFKQQLMQLLQAKPKASEAPQAQAQTQAQSQAQPPQVQPRPAAPKAPVPESASSLIALRALKAAEQAGKPAPSHLFTHRSSSAPQRSFI